VLCFAHFLLLCLLFSFSPCVFHCLTFLFSSPLFLSFSLLVPVCPTGDNDKIKSLSSFSVFTENLLFSVTWIFCRSLSLCLTVSYTLSLWLVAFLNSSHLARARCVFFFSLDQCSCFESLLLVVISDHSLSLSPALFLLVRWEVQWIQRLLPP